MRLRCRAPCWASFTTERASPPVNLTRIDDFAASVDVISCDAITAQYYGRIKDHLRSQGRPIPENDIWIAAVAMQHALPVATRDDHFKQVDVAFLTDNEGFADATLRPLIESTLPGKNQSPPRP